MSTILKALRRLEDSRSAQEERPLREAVTAGDGPRKRGRKRGRAPWLIAVTLILAAGIGAGTLAFWSAVEPAPPASDALASSATRAPERTPTPPEPLRPAAPGARREIAAAAPTNSEATVAAAPPRALPPGALTSSVELVARPPAGPRIDDSAELEVIEPAPGEPALVRGQPLLPPGQIPGRHATDRRSSVVAVAEPAPAPVATPQPAREERESPATRQPATKPEPRAEPAPSPRPTQRTAAARAPKPAPKPAPTPSVAPRSEPAAEPAPPDPRPSRAALTRAPEAAPPPTPAPRAEPSPPPKATSVPRAQIPDLVVARTSWHPTASRRKATVQLDAGAELEVKEGDAVGPLVVTRIEPSSVVFLHEGLEIRRRVGQR